MRDGQNEHVADKGGVYSPVQSSSSCVCVCSLCVALQSKERESAMRIPFLGAAAIKADHKMASKALPAKLNTKKKNAALMQLSLAPCGT